LARQTCHPIREHGFQISKATLMLERSIRIEYRALNADVLPNDPLK
jgi:hypothetical protein